MNKYDRLVAELEEKNTGKLKVFGNSMLPRIKSGSLLTYVKQDSYEVDDVVLSKVRGRWIDAHKIHKKDDQKGYLIGNNHGYENGWTKKVFAKVTQAEIDHHTHEV